MSATSKRRDTGLAVSTGPHPAIAENLSALQPEFELDTMSLRLTRPAWC